MMETFYRHDFANVEDYLHHRPPYLLVDRIVSIGEETIETEKTITGEEYFLKGHFPGLPIFPGAMMQELTTQSAGILIAARFNPMKTYNTHDPSFNAYALGVLVRVKRAKYSGFARPGDVLHAKVKLNELVGNMFDFSASIFVDDQMIMRNAFQLTNVKTAVLYGEGSAAG
jgi:3-hydroxyacyl-[acyl-carrier-protein] dehydratase